MHSIPSIAHARSPKARKQRFLAGMALLIGMLVLYCVWPPSVGRAAHRRVIPSVSRR